MTKSITVYVYIHIFKNNILSEIESRMISLYNQDLININIL